MKRFYDFSTPAQDKELEEFDPSDSFIDLINAVVNAAYEEGFDDGIEFDKSEDDEDDSDE